MPECEHYEELISAYLDNELSPDEAQELAAHLQSCPKCAALLNTYTLLFAKSAVAAAPAGFANSVMGMTSTVKAPQRAKKRAPIIRFFAAAAACLLLIGASYPLVSSMVPVKGTDSTTESAEQNASVTMSMTTGTYAAKLESETEDSMAVASIMDEVMAENAKAAEPKAEEGTVGTTFSAGSSTADTGAAADASAAAGTDTALLIIDGTVPAEESDKRGSNAVYIYGELPESCQNLDFSELAESNGTAFIAQIEKELADELILNGHEHDSGEIFYLIWYPN